MNTLRGLHIKHSHYTTHPHLTNEVRRRSRGDGGGIDHIYVLSRGLGRGRSGGKRGSKSELQQMEKIIPPLRFIIH